MKAEKIQYNAIDIFKFICAILICTIHVSPFPNNVPEFGRINFYIVNCISRIAVPFYFTAAGFFLFKKMPLDKIDTKVIKEYCFKLLRLIGTWWVLLFIGPKGQMWYLGASIIAIILITFLLEKKVKLKYIIIIAILLYIIGLLGDTYYQIIRIAKSNHILNNIITNYETYFQTTKNGLFFGTIFVLMGVIIAHKNIKMDFKWAYIGTFLSYVLLMIETSLLAKYFNPKDYNMYISIVPLVFFIFHLLLNVKLKDHMVYKKLRIISILIFFTHRMFIYLSNNLISTIYIKYKVNLTNYHFLITLFITILFSILIEELSQTKKLKILKYLYS